MDTTSALPGIGPHLPSYPVQPMDDAHDLSAWTEHRDETAFARLMRRHTAMVAATCRRELGRGEVDSAIQAVFIVLARRAGSIRDPARLGSWLFAVAVRVCAAARRQEKLRSARERAAAATARRTAQRGDDDHPQGPDPAWEQVQVRLNEALAALDTTNRALVIDHYLGGQRQAAVAARLGISEDAARKRIAYALQKLRSWFARRGVPLSVGALASGLMAEAVALEPARVARLTTLVLSPARGGTAMLLAATVIGRGTLAATVPLVTTSLVILGGMGAWAIWSWLPPQTPPTAVEADVPNSQPAAAPSPAMQRILAQRVVARYQRHYPAEVLADLQRRHGLIVGLPPRLRLAFTVSAQGDLSVRDVLAAVASAGGLDLTIAGDD